MIVSKEVVEAPVLESLFHLAKRPRPNDALLALRERSVQDATLEVAQKMRHIAMLEDERRAERKESPINYRKFYVAGVGIGLILSRNHRAPYEWWVFAAYNSKPSKKSCKFCAEMRIMRAAREVPFVCMGGLTVLGENQPDGRSGELRKTLDPCGDCRDMMRDEKFRYMFRKGTLICTARPLSQVRYVETLSVMMAAHREHWP
jgi:hypothetical protein